MPNSKDISEDTFNQIMDKLMHTITNYEVNFRELSFLKEEIESLKITGTTRLNFLKNINKWTDDVASRSYVIRFVHHRLKDDITDAAKGEYKPERHRFYLEFGY